MQRFFSRQGSMPRLSTSTDGRHHPHYDNVFKAVYFGTLLLLVTLLALIAFSVFAMQHTELGGQLVIGGMGLLYLALIFATWRRGHHYTSSVLLVLLYMLLSTMPLVIWGINVPLGLLLAAITTLLAGILLGGRSIIFVAGYFIVLILGLQYCITYLGYAPALSDNLHASYFGDAVAYSVAITVVGIVSWLFTRQTDRFLREAREAQEALSEEKELLEVRVKERTAALEEAKREEARQLHQFVEIGQLSAALVHDLANHLSVLQYDLEEIKQERHSKVMERAQESLGHLDQVVNNLRDRLHGIEVKQRFSLAEAVQKTVKNFHKTNNITVTMPSKNLLPHVTGDPARLAQVLNILLNNAFEACSDCPVEIHVEIAATREKRVQITVEDQGQGVANKQALFKPTKSQKKTGLGIGLFLARKIIETHFNGTLECTHAKKPTRFTISIPYV